MWNYLSKLELKNSFVYYLFLSIFFFFWNFFSLFSIFLYTNFQQIAKNYKNHIYLNLIIYPEKSQHNAIVNLVNDLNQLPYIKKIEIFTPEKIFYKIKDSLPAPILKNYQTKELINYLPYMIKIYPSSFKHYRMLKEQLKLLKTSHNINIYESKISKLVNFAFILKPGFICFFITWIIFYIFFLLFLNYFLNSFLQKQIKVFLLLGGSLIQIKFIRLFFMCIFLSLGAFLSFIIFSYISKNLSIFFNIFSSNNNFLCIHKLIIYYIFTILILPFTIIWLSYKNYES